MLTFQDIIIDPPLDDELFDPMLWFDSPGPFELEIGCGKGGFLLHRAMANPHIRMLGIEWANKFYKYCADRMARRGATNVRVMRTDAKFFVMNHLPPDCVSVLHLYHPDPWPKKRHHKRRLVQEPFVDAAVRVLVRGGQWIIQSDHAEYFEQMHSVIGGHCEMRKIPWEESAAPVVRPPEVEGDELGSEEGAEAAGDQGEGCPRVFAAGGSRFPRSEGTGPPSRGPEALTKDEERRANGGGEWKGTNFEIKYAREGREIYRAAFQRAGEVA